MTAATILEPLVPAGRLLPIDARQEEGWNGRAGYRIGFLSRVHGPGGESRGSMGRNCLVKLLTRCDLPLPAYFIADEKHTHCLDKRVYLPTMGCGRVIWHLGYTMSKSVRAFAASYGEFKRAALAIDPSYNKLACVVA